MNAHYKINASYLTNANVKFSFCNKRFFLLNAPYLINVSPSSKKQQEKRSEYNTFITVYKIYLGVWFTDEGLETTSCSSSNSK